MLMETSLAPYAMRPEDSRGRLHDEADSGRRSPFERDRDRIIHSTAFRRLEYKTQVFVNHEGDHYRTRLTHSLEVAQLSRAIARALKLNEDLAEAFALSHDLGHTPFGHAGEDALNDAMKHYGGFDHNAQTIRILTKLEQRYAHCDGLNLTWETLEGIAKHNGPLIAEGGSVEPLPRALKEYVAQHDLELHRWPSLEAQVAAIADDIAYHNHDLEDGLRANLFSIDEVLELPLAGERFAEVRDKHPTLDRSRWIKEAIRWIIHDMVEDVIVETLRRLEAANIERAEDVRAHDGQLVGFSEAMFSHNKQMKAFLMGQMYRHYKVNRMTHKARRIVRELFEVFMDDPTIVPPEWRMGDAESLEFAEGVADYIAGMTDRFAMQEYDRIFRMDVLA